MNKLSSFLEFIVGSKSSSSAKSGELSKFVDFVVNDELTYPYFDVLEGTRNTLLVNHDEIEIVDLGAGSSFSNRPTKKISEVAKQQLSSAYQLRVISRIIQFTKAEHCVELGASLGLSSFYMAKSTLGNCVSFEGNPAFIQLIEDQKKNLNISNLNLIEGNFDDTFSTYVKDTQDIDFAFIDGNHRKRATIDYFEQVKASCREQAVLVFDDIYWSKGMNEAWNHIKADSMCRSSIDLYFMGIVFLDPTLKKKVHLKIRPKKWF